LGANSSPGCVFVFPLVTSFKSANESTILYPGLEFAPPLAAFPIFKLDASSSVIYNLYGRNLKNLTKILKDGSNGPNTIQQFSNVLLYGLFHKCIAKILPSAIPVKRTVCKSGTLRFRP
jgi:hypothetical protein